MYWEPSPLIRGSIEWGRADRPAVLLFHGMGMSGPSSWEDPFSDEWNYDHDQDPGDRDMGTHGQPPPLRSLVRLSCSDRRGRRDSKSWWELLRSLDCTVAEWDQPGETFAEALPSALAAFLKFLEDTRARFPSAPPPVVLLGHSRGGLLIRQVLKELGPMGRVRWVITLCSPHAGSELGGALQYLTTSWIDNVDLGPFNPQRNAIRDLVRDTLRPATELVMKPRWKELAPGSSLLRDLADGERAFPEISYVTFGGTNTQVFRLYAWFYTPHSFTTPITIPPSPPSYHWVLTPKELPGVSPQVDAAPNLTDEITPGKGDIFVADARSRLPWASTHHSVPVNHLEVLWDLPVQVIVTGLLLQTARIAPNAPIQFEHCPYNTDVVRSLIVRSVGPGQLTVSSITPPSHPLVRTSAFAVRADTGQAEPISLTDPVSLNPAQYLRIELTLTATAPEGSEVADSIVIHNNSPNDPEHTVPVGGYADKAPRTLHAPPFVDFGDNLQPADPIEAAFEILNDGELPVSVTSITLASKARGNGAGSNHHVPVHRRIGFAITGAAAPPFTLQKGEAKLVEVTFYGGPHLPWAGEQMSDRLIIRSDADTPETTVILYAGFHMRSPDIDVHMDLRKELDKLHQGLTTKLQTVADEDIALLLRHDLAQVESWMADLAR